MIAILCLTDKRRQDEGVGNSRDEGELGKRKSRQFGTWKRNS